MAYMSSEKKAKLAPAIKQICAKHGVKASLSVRNHTTLVLTISEGKIDFFKDAHESAKESGSMEVSVYWISERYTGTALAFLTEAHQAMMDGNHDRSDLMTDYYEVGWYAAINVGKWDKPYKLTK